MESSRNAETSKSKAAASNHLLVWVFSGPLEATEFSGGRVTGPLLMLFDTGLGLFVLALFLTFPLRRVAAVIALAASFVSLPLYLYFVAPGPFRRVFKGEYSVPLQANLVWNTWAIAGILALAFAVYWCLRTLAPGGAKGATKQQCA